MEEPKIYCNKCKQLLGEIILHHQEEHNLSWPESWEVIGEDDE